MLFTATECPIVNSSPSEEEGVGDYRQLPLAQQIAPIRQNLGQWTLSDVKD